MPSTMVFALPKAAARNRAEAVEPFLIIRQVVCEAAVKRSSPSNMNIRLLASGVCGEAENVSTTERIGVGSIGYHGGRNGICLRWGNHDGTAGGGLVSDCWFHRRICWHRTTRRLSVGCGGQHLWPEYLGVIVAGATATAVSRTRRRVLGGLIK